MQRKTRRIIGAVALIAALAAGGAALTAASTVPNTTSGYATSTVSGANATQLVYTLDNTGNITLVTMLFTENLTAGGPGESLTLPAKVMAGFNAEILRSCAVGLYVPTVGTTVTCSAPFGTDPELSTNVTAFHVAVSSQ